MQHISTPLVMKSPEGSQREPQHGLTRAAGRSITVSGPAIPAEEMRTAVCVIESMQRDYRLKISSETRGVEKPMIGHDGEIYGWEYDLEETGHILVHLKDPTEAEVNALALAVMPGSKDGIHIALERLAQIKPIGKSEVKQATVLSALVYDLHDEGISEYVVNELCREYRRSTAEFFPNSGQFFQSARQRMAGYVAAFEKAADKAHDLKPEAKEPEVRFTVDGEEPAVKKWPDMSLEERIEFVARMKSTMVLDDIFYRFLLPVYEVTREDFNTVLEAA